ncbi:LuxR C-terminal-related transcriptional regulator [Hamadaea tsunoensis]|uniref:LuxR C-terminal-related transcriptional regulator n=1 Tax=Hamadaea tsunoensis TaxID=53368 RepID=UPI0004120E03|nr:response regulator transcription factor [Hamadaea tsunoensis]
MTTGPVRVLLADDQPMVRSGLRAVLGGHADLHVVGEAGDGVEAIELARRLLPDVLLIEAYLPRRDATAVAREIRDARLPVRTLVLIPDPGPAATGPAAGAEAGAGSGIDAEPALAALRSGASGLLAQDAPPEEIIAAVRAVAAGHAAVSPPLLRRLLDLLAAVPPATAARTDLGMLTDREREVLVQVARGLSNAEIAQALTVSETTVKTHVGHVLTKLRLRDRVQAVVLAYESGLVKPGR